MFKRAFQAPLYLACLLRAGVGNQPLGIGTGLLA